MSFVSDSTKNSRPTADQGGDRTLLDKFMPAYDFAEKHAVEIESGAEMVFRHAASFRMRHDPTARLLLTLRFPSRRTVASSGRSMFDFEDFTLLYSEPDKEIIRGLIVPSRVDSDSICVCRHFSRGGGFPASSFYKLTFTLSVHPISASKCILSTETRVKCNGLLALLLFSPYWLLIRAPSGLLRRRMLSLIKEASEQERKSQLSRNRSP
ncbi:hypothetical protein NKW84_16865 [Acetobacter senegalensis]|uniref:hypothetical protein n=1 Tax=Acetobacter senegalensis TaxID=446692 RepID=UPI0020A096EF|nr:hypothetical protein [Acetobacter senegalensis]MCP1197506.1 hypothetical protein [Acetobacter senegalensis]